MSFELRNDDMKLVNIGACVLASGGGGSYLVSNKIIDDGVPPGAVVEVLEVEEIPGDQWIAVSANMGSPGALFKTANPHAPKNAFIALQQWCQGTGKSFDGRYENFDRFNFVLPIEIGAINAASPLTVAAQLGIPIINADGAGRSIPTLPLTTFAGSIPLFPNYVASEAPPGTPFNTGQVDVPDEKTLEQAIIGLVMTEPFGGIAGLAIYAMNGQTLKAKPPVSGTLIDALRIGSIYNSFDGQHRADHIVEYLNVSAAKPRNARQIFHGHITQMVEAEGGTDIGQIVISAADKSGTELWIYNQNENIFASLNTQAEPYIMGPDSICYVPAFGEMFDNSDLWNMYQKPGYEPIEVYIVGIDAPDVVKHNPQLMANWQAVRSQFGYSGPYTQNWLYWL